MWNYLIIDIDWYEMIVRIDRDLVIYQTYSRKMICIASWIIFVNSVKTLFCDWMHDIKCKNKMALNPYSENAILKLSYNWNDIFLLHNV